MALDLTRYLDSSSQRRSGVRCAMTDGFRRRQSTRRWYGFLSVVRPRRVVRPGRLLGLPQALRAGRDFEFSEHRRALNALRQLHTVAGASSLDAPLSMSPSFDAPAHLSAVHDGRLIADRRPRTRDLRHF